MLRFIVRRTAAAFATLAGVVTLVFLLMSLAPGDPAKLLARGAGRAASPEAVAAFRAAYGLDRPLPERFVRWVSHAATFSFGRSFLDGRDVADRIAETLPATLALNAGAIFLAALLGVPLGILAARRAGGRFDHASAFVLDVLFAAPSFVLGLGLLLVFSVRLRVTPLFADPSEGWRGFVLPIATLALASLAPLSRFTRACVLEALRSPSGAAARARGEGESAQIARALRRAGVDFAAMGAALLPTAVAGSVLVERLFSLEGTGRLLAEAVFSRDLPTVLALTLLAGSVVVAGSFAADVVSAFLDPRTREQTT